jgi:uncharacterized protein YeaO (DUF488 family)
MGSSMVKLKRAYEAPTKDDGERVLVERLWPRGLTKQKAKIDLWVKEISPSTELRKWFGHDPEKWDEFRRRYKSELKQQPELVDQLRDKARKGPITFVYAAKDELHNSALLLKEFVESGNPQRTKTKTVSNPRMPSRKTR